jgi:hypothetical protein
LGVVGTSVIDFAKGKKFETFETVVLNAQKYLPIYTKTTQSETPPAKITAVDGKN